MGLRVKMYNQDCFGRDPLGSLRDMKSRIITLEQHLKIMADQIKFVISDLEKKPSSKPIELKIIIEDGNYDVLDNKLYKIN